jgi:hypothetical protein
VVVTKKSAAANKTESKSTIAAPKADDDGWETTPLKSVPIKKPDPSAAQKNWLQKAEEDAKAKAEKALAEKAKSAKAKAEQAKADKERARKKRYNERHKDDWMKLSPDDTDW